MKFKRVRIKRDPPVKRHAVTQIRGWSQVCLSVPFSPLDEHEKVHVCSKNLKSSIFPHQSPTTFRSWLPCAWLKPAWKSGFQKWRNDFNVLVKLVGQCGPATTQSLQLWSYIIIVLFPKEIPPKANSSVSGGFKEGVSGFKGLAKWWTHWPQCGSEATQYLQLRSWDRGPKMADKIQWLGHPSGPSGHSDGQKEIKSALLKHESRFWQFKS